MPKEHHEIVEEKLDAIVGLLKNLLALELFKNGVTQDTICKRVRLSKTKVVEMLEGVKKAK